MSLSRFSRLAPISATILAASACSSSRDVATPPRLDSPDSGAVVTRTGDVNGVGGVANDARTPNELGRIPVLEYHVIGGKEGMFTRPVAKFRADLELLYARGYRPVTVAQLLDKSIDLPRGLSPVVFTFDDASPSQFRWIKQGDKRVLDDTSALGIWRAFQRMHNDWGSRATFCLLSGAAAGRSLFGDKGIEGQESAWRFEKVRELAKEGFELCDHTLWHATLSHYPAPVVQEQIARGAMAIDSAIPGYRVRTFALPLGVWPKDRSLAQRGEWTDKKSGRTVRYAFDAILEVAGGPSRSPHDPAFNPLSIPRTIVAGNALESTLDALDKGGNRYVSDGDPHAVAQPPATVAKNVAPQSAASQHAGGSAALSSGSAHKGKRARGLQQR